MDRRHPVIVTWLVFGGARKSMIRMITAVVILVAIAAFQGIYNLLKEAHHEFDLVDPIELAEEQQSRPEDPLESFPEHRRAA